VRVVLESRTDEVGQFARPPMNLDDFGTFNVTEEGPSGVKTREFGRF
jgi:hypothetical protein